jgi:abortive infection bacteriophage resistance protein
MPLQPFSKPSLSYQQQVQKLQSNGMSVGNEVDAITTLSTVSYYRLSGY